MIISKIFIFTKIQVNNKRLQAWFKNNLIAFYNILASYYQKASELDSNENRDELHMQANSYINMAMNISYQEASTSIIRGYSSIDSGKLVEAEQEFNHVIHQNSLDVLSLIGKAVVYYKKEQYEKALDQYKKIIRNNPLWPLSVYNAAAIWFYKLGNADHAKLIFSKILEKDADNEIALWGMATVDIEDALINITLMSYLFLTIKFFLWDNNKTLIQVKILKKHKIISNARFLYYNS